MATQFTSTYVERKITLSLDTPDPDASVVRRAEATISGEYVLNLNVVLFVGTAHCASQSVWLYDYLESEEQYKIARDAARAALRKYKVKAKDLSTEGNRLVNMDRATHAAARENELADYYRATGLRRPAA